MGQLEDLAEMARAIGASDLSWEEKAKNLRGLQSQAEALRQAGRQQQYISQTNRAGIEAGFAWTSRGRKRRKHVTSTDVTEREKKLLKGQTQ